MEANPHPRRPSGASARPHIVDLTRPLGPDTPVPPGDPAVVLDRVAEHSPDGYEVTRICLGSHSGTHIDAPRHFFPHGSFLSDYPPERFVARGVVLDVRFPPSGVIDRDFLAGKLEGIVLQPGDFALLWTGYDPEGAGETYEEPVLASEAATLLLDLGVSLVGTDANGLDAEPYPVHRLLLGADVLLAEGLCNLELLGAGSVQCAFLPLFVTRTDGAPIRAIAWRLETPDA